MTKSVRQKKVVHLLYGGIGGHGSVFFSMVKASQNSEFVHVPIFYGIEKVRSSYIDKCNELGLSHKVISKNRGIDLLFFLKVFREVRRESPEVLFLHGSYLSLMAWLVKVFSVKELRMVIRETQANHLKTKKDWLFLKVALPFSDAIVFLSTKYKEEIEHRKLLFYNSRRSWVIPNGIDLTFFKPDKRPNLTDTIRIGMLSRLVDIKDHKTLLKAVSIIKLTANKQVHLSIYGDGATRSSLESYSSELGLADQVDFAGAISEEEIPDALNQLDIYVHASFGETMSTSIMQAQACGLPIIASDVSGINNVIEDSKNGILVPVEDAEKLSEAIISLISNETTRSELGDASLDYAKTNLSNKKMMDSYLELFRNL
ncbi:MAG: hypothetical protein CL840_22095 [Crocinitomicaceae bacterium]|nr:hypothetical protein [Crocinitomicaceae bacterium]|tara:strand:- start:27880 stop:28995 length:1116 start_codon:yes stop_codon:yes gene_type:complete